MHRRLTARLSTIRMQLCSRKNDSHAIMRTLPIQQDNHDDYLIDKRRTSATTYHTHPLLTRRSRAGSSAKLLLYYEANLRKSCWPPAHTAHRTPLYSSRTLSTSHSSRGRGVERTGLWSPKVPPEWCRTYCMECSVRWCADSMRRVVATSVRRYYHYEMMMCAQEGGGVLTLQRGKRT